MGALEAIDGGLLADSVLLLLGPRQPQEITGDRARAFLQNTIAQAHVTRVMNLPAPRPPNTCWVLPPERAAESPAASLLQEHHEDEEQTDEHMNDREERARERLRSGGEGAEIGRVERTRGASSW